MNSYTCQSPEFYTSAFGAHLWLCVYHIAAQISHVNFELLVNMLTQVCTKRGVTETRATSRVSR